MQYEIGGQRPYAFMLRYRDAYLDTVIAQIIFLNKNHEEFFKEVKDKLLPKILLDISYILKREWADRIYHTDFDHVHICGNPSTAIPGLDKRIKEDMQILMSSQNVCFLYHTRENHELHTTKQMKNRNIISNLTSEPVPVNPDYEPRDGFFYTVDYSDLQKLHYAQIRFRKDPRGIHQLEDETKLSMTALLSTRMAFYEYVLSTYIILKTREVDKKQKQRLVPYMKRSMLK